MGGERSAFSMNRFKVVEVPKPLTWASATIVVVVMMIIVAIRQHGSDLINVDGTFLQYCLLSCIKI